MADDMAAVMKRERAEVDRLLADIEARRAKLDEEEATIVRRVAAIEAYEAAMAGKELVVRQKRKSRSTRGKSRKSEVLECIKKHPNGIAPAEIIEALGAKGDKAAEGGIRNALTTLKKDKSVGVTDGKYLAAR